MYFVQEEAEKAIESNMKAIVNTKNLHKMMKWTFTLSAHFYILNPSSHMTDHITCTQKSMPLPHSVVNLFCIWTVSAFWMLTQLCPPTLLHCNKTSITTCVSNMLQTSLYTAFFYTFETFPLVFFYTFKNPYLEWMHQNIN